MSRSARLIASVYLAALTAYVLLGVPVVPFHGDESTQIYMTHDYAYQFITGDPDRVRYDDDPAQPALQELRLINGSINRYSAGFAWHAAGYTPADINQPWDWGADWDYNLRQQHAPPPGLLVAARYPSAIFTALSVAALFALGSVVGGLPVAYLASLYYALNPAVLVNGRRAMMEGSLLLTEILVVLAGLVFLRRPSWWRALLLGVVSGVALSAKHTNLFTVGAVGLVCLLLPLLMRTPTRPRGLVALQGYGVMLVVAGISAGLIFIALNPVWWGRDPVEQALLILRLRGDLLAGQTATFGGYDGPLDQLAGFGRQALVTLPMYYEVPNWGAWIADQIARYEASVWTGVSIGGTVTGALLLLGCIVAGFVTFIRDATRPLATRWLVGGWAVVTVLTTLILTPLEWQRYYLPVYPVTGLFGALGAVRFYRLAWSHFAAARR